MAELNRQHATIRAIRGVCGAALLWPKLRPHAPAKVGGVIHAAQHSAASSSSVWKVKYADAARVKAVAQGLKRAAWRMCDRGEARKHRLNQAAEGTGVSVAVLTQAD
jgi:hypothetical protein